MLTKKDRSDLVVIGVDGCENAPFALRTSENLTRLQSRKGAYFLPALVTNAKKTTRAADITPINAITPQNPASISEASPVLRD